MKYFLLALAIVFLTPSFFIASSASAASDKAEFDYDSTLGLSAPTTSEKTEAGFLVDPNTGQPCPKYCNQSSRDESTVANEANQAQKAKGTR